mmetsp:Transcript_53153/g.159074  ORF Transcript_53153/g.159074 Transcript_53153/m.159074 type:complete len:306 (-) Transcript_53153:898-1815(-)
MWSGTRWHLPPVMSSLPASASVALALVLFILGRCEGAAPTDGRTGDDADLNSLGQRTYGVDTSFPIHHSVVSPAASNPLGDRQSIYDSFVSDCRSYFGRKGNACDHTEKERVAMSLRQPRAMQNYTELGFKKIRAPEKVFRLISDFWDKNKDNTKMEKWYTGNTYVNHWDTQVDFVSVEDGTLRGGGALLKARIWEAAKSTLEEWIGEELSPCSLYGIRIYHAGAILAPHVDRMPLVTSAIINVAQDLDEAWPLEVYGASTLKRVFVNPLGFLNEEMTLPQYSHRFSFAYPFQMQPMMGEHTMSL